MESRATSQPQFTQAEIASLQTAYEQAIYEVYDGENKIELSIGEHALELERIIPTKYSSWALITAYNPYSQLLSEAENWQRHQKLLDYLSSQQLTSLAALGKDRKDIWIPEPSLLIFGLNRTEAIAIGRKFQQNAIVYGELHQPVELLWVDHKISQ